MCISHFNDDLHIDSFLNQVQQFHAFQVPIITAALYFPFPGETWGISCCLYLGSYRWSPRLLPSLRLHWFLRVNVQPPIQWGPAKSLLPRPAEVGHWVTSVLIPSFGKYHPPDTLSKERLIPEHSTLSQFWYEAVSYLKCYIQVCCPNGFSFWSQEGLVVERCRASTVEMKQNCELKEK